MAHGIYYLADAKTVSNVANVGRQFNSSLGH